MYQFDIRLPQNRNPWERPFLERIAEYYQNPKNRKIVLAIYDRPDTSTFRYRIYNVWQTLQQSQKICFLYFYRFELEKIWQIIPKTDLVVFSRCQWTLDIQQAIDIAKSHRIPVCFDIDDYFFDLQKLQLITNTLNVRLKEEFEYNFWAAMIGRTQMVAAQADCFTTTNSYLGEKLSNTFGKEFYVIENSLNREQLEISRLVREQKAGQKRNNPFTIGYFSGTPSHINDFRTVSSELLALLKTYSDMQLLVVGFMDFPAEYNSFIKNGRVIFHPLVDFLELQIKMGEVDVNIAPLINNSFTNCKSELKFFEASIVNTPTLATPTYTFKNAIKHGESGFLCQTGDWYPLIEYIYKHPKETEQMVRQAREYSLRQYSGDYFFQQVENTYLNILDKESLLSDKNRNT